MPMCWTCGSPMAFPVNRCPNCESLGELQKLRGDLGTLVEGQRGQTAELKAGFAAVADGVEAMASAIAWGLESVEWAVTQQTEVLRGIDLVLKTPAETEANEKRLIGEQLRERGVLDQAEQFFRRALELYPLDFRTYIGLGHTLLQAVRMADARDQFAASLPHAPKQPGVTPTGIADWRSYSLRLIGRTWVCEDDLPRAVGALEEAVALSPAYPEALYDLSVYLAQSGQGQRFGQWLEKAILYDPLKWYLARQERAFSVVRDDVDHITDKLLTSAEADAADAIARAEATLTVLAQKDRFVKLADAHASARDVIHSARERQASGDYSAVREVPAVLERTYSLVPDLKEQAAGLAEKARKRDIRLLITVGGAVVGGFLVALLGGSTFWIAAGAAGGAFAAREESKGWF